MSDFSTNYSSVRTDRGLSAQVVDGVISQTKELEKIKTADELNKLGKDSFLQLLCAQMENQDPLQPQSNTEWVSQLATYSSLEQMQNMNATMTNSQAFSLIGQEVILATKTATGEETTVSGLVDFVSVKGNKAYLSIKGNLYPSTDLQSIVDPRYLTNSMMPKVEAGELHLNKNLPQLMSFKVELGKEVGKAEGLALNVGGRDIEAKYFTVSENGVVTLSPDAFNEYKVGRYPVTVRFLNDFGTTDSTSLKLVISEEEVTKEAENAPAGGAANEAGTGNTNTASSANIGESTSSETPAAGASGNTAASTTP